MIVFRRTEKSTLQSGASGLTLVEVLIAMTMTLVVLGAMMSAFQYGSAEMQKGRATIELNNRLISAQEQLRMDLDRITVEAKSYHSLPALPNGYLEIVDGPQTDRSGPDNGAGLFGDTDDYFAFTIRSSGSAFRGRWGQRVEESHLAEVAWYVIPNLATADTSDSLVARRQLLIKPVLGTLATITGVANGASTATQDRDSQVANFFADNDISARVVLVSATEAVIVANSLTDLALRGNRFAHANGATPQLSVLDDDRLPVVGAAVPLLSALLDVNGNRVGKLVTHSSDKHIMLTSVAAFDVQVYAEDAFARVLIDATAAAGPTILDVSGHSSVGDAQTDTGFVALQTGSYVDLGKVAAFNTTAPFQSSGSPSFSVLPTSSTVAGPYTAPGQLIGVYDTGTSQYDRDQANDQGANGVDNGGIVGEVDDAGEKVSIAPYRNPIRGLRVRMRVFEPITKRVRQVSVTRSLVTQ